MIPIVVQVNGKVRSSIDCEMDTPDDEVLDKAFLDENVKKYVDGRTIVKMIVMKNRLVDLVVK